MKNPSVEKLIANLLKVSVATAICVFFAACGGDSSSNSGTGSENSGTGSDTPVSTDIHSEENDASSYTPEEIIPIKNKTITGLAQKGPFKSGSTVDIFELELDGKTFAQTGKSFMGKVSNDSGAFKISNVSLKSQYALLRVTGNFKSEINGESLHATLTAVTDLSKRENVNVNILTHLEYDRVLYLLGKGMNFTAAKKQAEREVLAAFGIEVKFKNSEDLDVFGDSDADAALVAISKLVLAGDKKETNRDEEDLSRLLTEIATDIEEDGEWNDYSGTIEKARDVHSTTHFNKEIIAYRAHVSSSCYCSIGKSCFDDSKIEKYMCHFQKTWEEYSGYGFYCMSNINQSFFRDSGSVVSGWDIFYFCKDGMWYEASLDDANTYSWSAGKDGEIRKGEFSTEYGYECSEIYGIEGRNQTCSDVYYKYDGEKGEWCRATSVEVYIYNDTYKWPAGKDGELRKGDYSEWYYKYDEEKGEWRLATSTEANTYKWSAGKDGEIKKGDLYEMNYKYYKYDEEKGEWLEASTKDLQLRACTMKHDGEIEENSDDLYLCRDGNWNLAGKDGEIKNEKYYDEELEQWVSLPENVEDLQIINDVIGFGCTKKKEGVCVPNGLTKKDGEFFFCLDSICDVSYMVRCKDGEWKLHEPDPDCEPEHSTWPTGKDGELRKSEKSRSYFKYDAKEGWTQLSLAEADVYNLPCSKDGSAVKGQLNLQEYVCDADTILVANDAKCYGYTEGKSGVRKNAIYTYTCKSGVWEMSDTLSKTSCAKDGSIQSLIYNEKDETNEFVCDADTFRVATKTDSSNISGYGAACVSYTEEKMNDSKTHICLNREWVWNGTYETFKDSRDGKKYKAIQIGSQKWMAENLNFEYRIYSDETSDSVSYGNYCNPDGCETYGRYYTWTAAMDSAGVYSSNGMGCGFGKTCSPTYPARGICPEDWHLPDAEEWATLYSAMQPNAMQAKGFREWNNATDVWGFAAFPAGYYYNDDFIYVGGTAGFWSSSEGNSSYAGYLYLFADDANLGSSSKSVGFSVRCVKD